MENKAVSDTGPIIHLSEINSLPVLYKLYSIIIPEEVESELHKHKIIIPKEINVKKLNPAFKDKIKIISNQHSLDLGESVAIALALQEKVNYFFTDDLDARLAAQSYSLEAHGSIGILLRAFREKLIDKSKVIDKIKELQTKSSLFITSDIVQQVIKSVLNFKEESDP